MSEPNQNSVAMRFQRRLGELAREGVFGKIQSRHAGLRSSYAHVVSLLDSPEVPMLLYGAKGTGKRRHVDELLGMHNFYRRLTGRPEGVLKVFRGDFVTDGYTSLLAAPSSSEGDLLYLEALDLLSASCQKELLVFLRRRKTLADRGLPLPRLVFGTERPLSMLVILKEFDQELFAAITGFAVFLPALSERSEDLLTLVPQLVLEITGSAQTPGAWLMDFIAKTEWNDNIDELRAFLKQGLERKAHLASWTDRDLPPQYQATTESSFVPWGGDDLNTLRAALVASRGDRRQGARTLGVPYSEFLERLLANGLR